LGTPLTKVFTALNLGGLLSTVYAKHIFFNITPCLKLGKSDKAIQGCEALSGLKSSITVFLLVSGYYGVKQ